METFSDKLRSSQESLTREGEQLLAAGRRFGATVRAEAEGWLGFALDRAAHLTTDVRRLPARVEVGALARVDGTLERVERRIRSRIHLLEAEVAADPPIEGYEALSAKDIVSRLEDLDPEDARAVLLFEQGHKARATVLRAAKARVAA